MGQRVDGAGARAHRRLMTWLKSFLAGVRQLFVLLYNEPPGC
jgi:hypothetical protein